MFRIFTLTALILAGFAAQAGSNHSSMTIQGDQRCITSNATPDHDIGQFPTRGNPNSFQAQTLRVCVDATPRLTGRTTTRVQTSGVTLSGILLRPGTAEYYDPNGRRGFSRNPASGWRVEGMGAALGMDHANAHVDHRGLYHYHAPADVWTDALPGTLIGYAADGFEIHARDGVESSWQLKSGQRPSGGLNPGGRHDGTYVEDYEYVAGSGDLDECNGAMVEGTYTYFATQTFPFFPRCFKGEVSRDFVGRR